MGAKGRKRKQQRKAKHRTGLINSLTGSYSSNQHNKRAALNRKLLNDKEMMMRRFGLL